MLKTLFIVLLLTTTAMLLLSVRLFFGKKRFIHTHIDGNKALNAKGIRCAGELDKGDKRLGRGLSIKETEQN